MDSLTECHGEVNTADMLMRYRMWLEHGMYTPDGNTYDSGITVATAIRSRHGCDGLNDNGNGSLMRVAPCAFYNLPDVEIKQVSAITHAHEISMTACVQYVRILEGLLNCVPSHKAITDSGFPFDPTIPRTEVESDTTASVAGALAGAVYGFDSIPTEWIEKLRGRELIDMYVSESELRC